MSVCGFACTVISGVGSWEWILSFFVVTCPVVSVQTTSISVVVAG